MAHKRKDGDKINFEFGGDWRYWSLPFSICYIPTPALGNTLAGGGVVCLRFLCLQLAIEWWNWTDEVTDFDTTNDVMRGMGYCLQYESTSPASYFVYFNPDGNYIKITA